MFSKPVAKHFALTTFLALLVFSTPVPAQVVQGGTRGDRPYGISLAPTALKAKEPTATTNTRSEQVMAIGEVLENFEGDYPVWIGDQSSGVDRLTTVIIRDQQEWTDLWLSLGKPVPIDLPRHRFAIAILSGPRESEGYHIMINDIRKVRGGLHIVYSESKPVLSELRPRQRRATSPWFIKLIPEVDGTIRFFQKK